MAAGRRGERARRQGVRCVAGVTLAAVETLERTRCCSRGAKVFAGGRVRRTVWHEKVLKNFDAVGFVGVATFHSVTAIYNGHSRGALNGHTCGSAAV